MSRKDLGIGPKSNLLSSSWLGRHGLCLGILGEVGFTVDGLDCVGWTIGVVGSAGAVGFDVVGCIDGNVDDGAVLEGALGGLSTTNGLSVEQNHPLDEDTGAVLETTLGLGNLLHVSGGSRINLGFNNSGGDGGSNVGILGEHNGICGDVKVLLPSTGMRLSAF